MMTFVNHEKQRAFQDRVGWENIMAGNKRIAEILGFEPEIEWAVGDGEGYCYNPKNIAGYYPTPGSQKAECEKWLKEQAERFPDGWVTVGEYKPMELKNYPHFESNWSAMMEAACRALAAGYDIILSTDIYQMWEDLNKKVVVA